jgi:hypothetical protein
MSIPLPPIEEYARFVQSFGPRMNAFVSSDDPEVQGEMIRLLGKNRVFLPTDLSTCMSGWSKYGDRKETGIRCIVEIFCLTVACASFKGTPVSSFSELVERMRKLQYGL